MPFFFVYAQECKVSESKKDEQHMAMPSDPGSALVIIQAEFFLELLVSLFYPAALVKEADKLKRRHILRHVAEKEPVLDSALFLPALYDKPDLLVTNAIPIAPDGPYSAGHRLNNKRLILTVSPKLKTFPFIHFFDKVGYLMGNGFASECLGRF